MQTPVFTVGDSEQGWTGLPGSLALPTRAGRSGVHVGLRVKCRSRSNDLSREQGKVGREGREGSEGQSHKEEERKGKSGTGEGAH